MESKTLVPDVTVSDQIRAEDLDELAARGVRGLICNRPDREAEDQPEFAALQRRARELGMEMHFVPVVHDRIQAADVEAFEAAVNASPRPLHAFCRSGLRSTTLWSLLRVKQGEDPAEVSAAASRLGYDFSRFTEQFGGVIADLRRRAAGGTQGDRYDVLIIGAGTAGITVAASLLRRKGDLRIALVDPAEKHWYQPGLTLVGGGLFRSEDLARPIASLLPKGASWIQGAVHAFEPEYNRVLLESGARVHYERLIVCPGIKLHWDGVEGLRKTLGQNGVTSNYHPDVAHYTWELVRQLSSGRALFTQPPLPIKCAGAPQKALYLAADHWQRKGVLDKIGIEFYNAGGALFSVKDYVPALERYMERYRVRQFLQHRLLRVDGPSRRAWFAATQADGSTREVLTHFDLLHVTPPQTAPDAVRDSPLADAAGWVDVDPATLRHVRFANVWSLGDACNAPNSKTAAAIRKQAPVVAANVVADIEQRPQRYVYEGYGACPLTVERGKVVLAEFGYGGKLQPTFPRWLLEGTRATRLAWFLKKDVLPPLYWGLMLKGREWLAKPREAPVE